MAEKLKPSAETESNRAEQRMPVERQRTSVEVEPLFEAQRELLDSARHEADKESVSARQIKLETEPEPAVKIGKHDKRRAYKQTIGLVQAGLPQASRSFSRFIHQPAIARVSEVAEKTVARPSAVLGAGLTATVGLAVMLFFARRYGFTLSGSEFILLLTVGWTLGLSVDLINQRFRRQV